MSRAEIIETIAILGALLALWPKVLSVDAPWYDYGILPLALLTMVVVLVTRVRRLNAAFEEAKRVVESQGVGQDGAAFPLAPPADSDREDCN